MRSSFRWMSRGPKQPEIPSLPANRRMNRRASIYNLHPHGLALTVRGPNSTLFASREDASESICYTTQNSRVRWTTIYPSTELPEERFVL